jgi:Mg2+/Co2+ transporter CorB
MTPIGSEGFMKYNIKFVKVIVNTLLVIIGSLPIIILVLFDINSQLGSLIYSSFMAPLFIVLARIFPDVFMIKRSEEVSLLRSFYKTSPMRSYFVILFCGAGILTFTWDVLVFPLFNIYLEMPTILLSMGVISFPMALEVYFLRK